MPNRRVYLTRIDGSIAATTIADGQGDYRFEVAPGPYRIEADRDEGLRTDSTVPGYKSRRLLLRAGRTVHNSFRTRHAGIIRGLVSTNGTPLPEQFLAVLDANGEFAGGVVTNEIGRYVISSLKPGTYTVTTSFAGSGYVPQAQTVQVAQKAVATADLALSAGSRITFPVNDATYPGANGSIDAELRNADGRVVKVFQGSTAMLPGNRVVFAGLPAGSYTLYVRRSAVPSDGPEQVDFPWQQVTIPLNGVDNLDLVAVSLDRPTTNLVGGLPKGGQLKLTAVPEDAGCGPAHIDGDEATPMAVNWTEQETGGQYVVRGIVPGAYAAAVTTALRERADKPSNTGGNLATTHSTVLVDGPAPTITFTAPKGAKVRGQFRYDSNNRLVIAPFGYRVSDGGDQSWLFPTVSEKQKFGKAFRVERLHAGKANGRLLDLDALYDEHPDVLIPDNLVSSARNEPGTSYWFTSGKRSFTLKEGRVLDLGIIRLKLHGVIGVRATLGHRELGRRSGSGAHHVRAARPVVGAEAQVAGPDLGAAEVLDLVEAERGQQRPQLGRVPAAAERLAELGHPRLEVGAVHPRLLRHLVGRRRDVEDDLATGDGRDRAQCRLGGLTGQVGHDSQPQEERRRPGVQTVVDEPLEGRLVLEVDTDVPDRVRHRDARLGQPRPLPRAGGGVVDLPHAQVGVGVAVGEGVEARAQHDRLPGAPGVRRGEGVLGEPVPDRDEHPQPGPLVAAAEVGDQPLAVAEDPPRQRVREDRGPVVLVEGAEHGGAEGGAARLALAHGRSPLRRPAGPARRRRPTGRAW